MSRVYAVQPRQRAPWSIREALLGVVLLLVLAPVPISPVRAQAGWVPTSLDLAAMSLAPADLTLLPDPPDPGFALAGGGYLSVAQQARYLARAQGMWRADAAATVASALGEDWRGHYGSRLAAPNPDLPGSFGAVIESSITEYAVRAGADTAFSQFAPSGPGAAAREVLGTLDFGDETRLTRSFVTATGEERPASRLELMIRAERLVVAVSLVDLTGEREWGVAAVEGLAAALMARVERVRSGDSPNLAPRLLRLDQFEHPRWVAPISDLYDRRDGETYPLAGVDPEDAADRELLYGTATDVYTYERFLAVGALPRFAVAPYYGVKLYRFPDAGAATAWLETAPNRLFENPGSFLDLANVENAVTIGDASRTIAYAFPANDSVTTRGYRIYARVGSDVARVQLDGEPEVSLAVVEAAALAQVDCLRRSVCETPPPFAPESLVAATPDVP